MWKIQLSPGALHPRCPQHGKESDSRERSATTTTFPDIMTFMKARPNRYSATSIHDRAWSTKLDKCAADAVYVFCHSSYSFAPRKLTSTLILSWLSVACITSSALHRPISSVTQQTIYDLYIYDNHQSTLKKVMHPLHEANLHSAKCLLNWIMWITTSEHIAINICNFGT